MKKTLRDYLPILMMLLCAAGFGALLLTGVIDLNTVPQLVEHRPVLAVLVILALFIAKGFSGVVVYNALVVVVSLILPLPAALAISGVGTALCLSISYWMGRSTRTDSLEGLLSRHPKLNKYFTATQQYGFVFCFTIHMLGLNMELLGVLFGMMRLNFWTYLSASWLSIAPGMVCLCILGNNLDFKSPVFWAMLALNLVLLLGSLWCIPGTSWFSPPAAPESARFPPPRPELPSAPAANNPPGANAPHGWSWARTDPSDNRTERPDCGRTTPAAPGPPTGRHAAARGW